MQLIQTVRQLELAILPYANRHWFSISPHWRNPALLQLHIGSQALPFILDPDHVALFEANGLVGTNLSIEKMLRTHSRNRKAKLFL